MYCGDTLRRVCVWLTLRPFTCTCIHGSKLLMTAGEKEPAKLSKSQVTRAIEVFFGLLLFGALLVGVVGPGVCMSFF